MRRRSEIPRSRHEWRVHSYKSNKASSRCHTLEAQQGSQFFPAVPYDLLEWGLESRRPSAWDFPSSEDSEVRIPMRRATFL